MEADEALSDDLAEYLIRGDEFPAFDDDEDDLNCGDFCVGKFSEDGCW